LEPHPGACLALSFGIEIVVFSPARRASRKLLERIVEFIRLAGGDAKICEFNQACRFEDRFSLLPLDYRIDSHLQRVLGWTDRKHAVSTRSMARNR
jgi:hypothetical protein